jgi:DNA-binding MarR family transcriptional regulator
MPSRHEALTGTSLRVYRHIYSRGPIHLSDLQRDLKFSSPAVAQYHLQKLMRLGLIREESDGYLADKVIFESMIRIRRRLIPLWATFSAFLATSLTSLLTLLRPPAPTTPSYLLSVITIFVSLLISIYETSISLKRKV